MAKISDLETQFESQSLKEIERINEITKQTFSTIEQDLQRQLSANHENMKSAISQSEKILIKRLNSKITAINEITKWSIWGAIFALILLALTATAWTFFLKYKAFENPYSNLMIEKCSFGEMCAVGQFHKEDGEIIPNVVITVYRK